MKTLLISAVVAGMGLTSAAFAQGTVMGSTRSGGKAAACIGCHGIAGYRVAYPHVYQVPLIAGQNAKYLQAALKAYQSGERKHPTMRSIAAGLSENDITELAAYYGAADQGAAK